MGPGLSLPAFLALGLLSAGMARSQVSLDLPWYVDQPISSVSLEATDGGLPGENLEPLLHVKQGQILTVRAIRADLAMLYRVGQFAAVEAAVEPWVGYDDGGNPFQAVRVVYRVVPPPRVRKIRADRARGLSAREVEAVAGVAREDPFFAVSDAPNVKARLEQHLEKAGYPRAQVTVEATPVDSRRVDLSISIQEGEPQRLASLSVVGAPNRLERRIARTISAAHVKEDRRVTREAVGKAREAVLSRLAEEGYPEARVNAVIYPAPREDQWGLTFVVNPGHRYWVDVRGGGLFSRKRIVDQLHLEDGIHLTPEAMEEMSARIVSTLQEDGWLKAQASVEMEEGPLSQVPTRTGAPLMERRTLVVNVDRGRRFFLESARFDGAQTFSNRYLLEAMQEASPEVMGRRRITPPAVDSALVILREFYRSQGFLSATLERKEIQTEERWFPGPIPTVLVVEVDEGVRTLLDNVVLEGDIGPGQAILEARRAELVGQPFNPAAMEALARAIVDAYREEGYLNADARPSSAVSEEGTTATTRITVTPNARVYLRNVVIQGHRRTRRSVIEKEISLTTGEPIIASAVERSRSHLYDLGLFRRVDPVLMGDEDRVKDLVVILEEYPNIALEAGGGASTDEGVKVLVKATHRNLWGRAHRLTGLGQVGLGYQGDKWRLDGQEAEWKAALQFETATLKGTGERLHVDALLNEERQENTYRLSTTGGGPGIRASGKAEVFLDYRVELRQMLDVDPGAMVAGDPWLPLMGMDSGGSAVGADGLFDPSLWGYPDTPSLRRLLSGPVVVVVVDERDDPQNPRRGSRFTLEARLYDGFLSDSSSALAQASFTRLLPMGPLGLLLSARGGVGQALEQRETLALEDRFFLGGAGSLRGYATDMVGPMNRVPVYDPGFPSQIQDLIDWANRNEAARWVPAGADSMAILTAEIKAPMPVLGFRQWPDAALVAFLDVGNGWFLDPDVTTTSTEEDAGTLFRVGTGLGFRYATPIGPLMLDLGINPDPIEERDEPWIRLHLSLGTL